MSLVLVAHGTGKPQGVAAIGDLAERVSVLLQRRVRTAFVDVVGPTPGELLSDAAETGRPAILVPAFLSRGYHVRTDLPVHVLASGHPDVTVTPALGPDPQITLVIVHRLTDAGWRAGDSVILGAAGTSDQRAQSDLLRTAALLGTLIGSRVELGFAATGTPRVADAVTALRNRGARRVVIASYLLADGLFQDRLRAAGADLVTEPLGTDANVAGLIADRFHRAEQAQNRPDSAAGGRVWVCSPGVRRPGRSGRRPRR